MPLSGLTCPSARNAVRRPAIAPATFRMTRRCTTTLVLRQDALEGVMLCLMHRHHSH